MVRRESCTKISEMRPHVRFAHEAQEGANVSSEIAYLECARIAAGRVAVRGPSKYRDRRACWAFIALVEMSSHSRTVPRRLTVCSPGDSLTSGGTTLTGSFSRSLLCNEDSRIWAAGCVDVCRSSQPIRRTKYMIVVTVAIDTLLFIIIPPLKDSRTAKNSALPIDHA